MWKCRREQVHEGHGEKQLPPEGAAEEELNVGKRK